MRRLTVAISGASGAIYGVRILEALEGIADIETHLVMSKPGERTVVEETGYRLDRVKAMASVVHNIHDIGASIASGSFKTMGMVVAPCSIHTLSAISHCITDNLLTRAADVVLKEHRKLILLVREAPLHVGHLRNMLAAAEMGAIILPPMPAFYSLPKTLDDVVNHTVGRVLDHFDVEHHLVKRWGEAAEREA